MSKAHIRVVVARIERGGRYLITQRMPHAVLPLLWAFPGWRVEEGEDDETALKRELKENLGIDAQVDGQSMVVTHEYERYHLDMIVFHVSTHSTPKPLKVHALKWVDPSDFGQYDFPGADQQTVDALLGE